MLNASGPRSVWLIVGFIVLSIWAASAAAQPPNLEVDEFPISAAGFEVQGPSGPIRAMLSGPVTVHVTIGSSGESADTDGDGLDQVPTEMVDLNLTGAGITVKVRDPAKDPFKNTVGEIEETFNQQSGRLDLPPFATTGTATSFFDVFFEITIPTASGPVVLHNRVPKHMTMTLTHKPPTAGEFYENPQVIDLYTEANEPSGFRMATARHVPEPELIPPGCVAKLLSSPPGVDVKISDSGGLFSVEITRQENLSVDLPAFPIGSKGPVLISARKQDPALRTRFELRVLDTSGNATVCDPIMTLQVRDDGKPVSETLNGIPDAEDGVTVLNGRPGLKTLHVEVNGKKFVMAGLKDGEERYLDVSSALRPGTDNVVGLTATGKPGGSAEVVIHD